MVAINRGYLHLLNNSTSTLTLSNDEFDMIGDNFGGFLEKNLEKMIKNHDRCPGRFREESLVKQVIEEFNRKETDLYNVSALIAKRLFQAREISGSLSKTALFIMEVADDKGWYVMGLEFPRTDKYQVSIQGASNSVILNSLILPNATPKRSMLFTINLSNLEVSVLDQGFKLGNEVLQINLGDSLNFSLFRARRELYQTLTKVENRDTEKQDIELSHDLEKIERVNKFESVMNEMVSNHRVIDFEKVAEAVFEEDVMLLKEFVQRLNGRVPLHLYALSDAPIESSFIVIAKEPKRLTLKNGVEVIIPEGLNELDPIVIKEIDGELVEVEHEERD